MNVAHTFPPVFCVGLLVLESTRVSGHLAQIRLRQLNINHPCLPALPALLFSGGHNISWGCIQRWKHVLIPLLDGVKQFHHIVFTYVRHLMTSLWTSLFPNYPLKMQHRIITRPNNCYNTLHCHYRKDGVMKVHFTWNKSLKLDSRMVPGNINMNWQLCECNRGCVQSND